MTVDRMTGWALRAGTVASIMTMNPRPAGHNFFTPGQFHSIARLGVAVHGLALIGLPVVFLGGGGLSQCLASARERR